MEPNERLDALVRSVRDLPALPSAVVRVMQLTDDPRSGAAEIAKALMTDQALAARILKLANSAFYGATRRVATVSEAVVLLGIRTTRNMAMAVSCRALLGAALPGYVLEPGGLWRHSLACATAAQGLAKRARYRVTEEAFVAGLIHDIGKVVLSTYLTDQFRQVLDYAHANDVAFTEAEREILGFDHAEAGARILEKWNLPGSLVESVRYHHAPLTQRPTPTPLTALVHVADVLCLTLGIGLGVDGMAYPLQPEMLELLRLTPDDFEQVASETCDILSHSDDLF